MLRDPPPSRRRYHHGSLRAALVEAAAQLAAERGPARLSLREVARRVGVSEAAPYYYFRNRAALLAAVADEGRRAFDAVQSAAMAEFAADPLHQLSALAASYVRFAIDRPHYFAVLFRPVVDAPPGHEPAPPPHQRLLDAARAARVASGHDDADAAAAAALIWAVPHGLALLYLDGPLATTVTPRVLEDLARMAMAPLAAAPLDELERDAPWGV